MELRSTKHIITHRDTNEVKGYRTGQGATSRVPKPFIINMSWGGKIRLMDRKPATALGLRTLDEYKTRARYAATDVGGLHKSLA